MHAWCNEADIHDAGVLYLYRYQTDSPLGLCDLRVNHSARGRVGQLSPKIMEYAGVDSLLNNHHRKLGPGGESEASTADCNYHISLRKKKNSGIYFTVHFGVVTI